MVKKITRFSSKYFWPLIIGGNVVIGILIILFTGKSGMCTFYRWFMRVSFEDNGNLITISTVLIGIYFSLYTYILSADLNSFLAKINLKEFKKLIRMINIGFCSSMLIVLLSFVNTELFAFIGVGYILIVYILFIMIFGSLIEISLYYTAIFKYDLEKRYQQFELTKQENEQNKLINNKLRNFLEQQNYD